MRVQNWIWEASFMIQPHLHVTRAFGKTELQQSFVLGQVRQIEFLDQLVWDIASIDRSFFRFRELVDSADS
jgi:hypothetical protein